MSLLNKGFKEVLPSCQEELIANGKKKQQLIEEITCLQNMIDEKERMLFSLMRCNETY